MATSQPDVTAYQWGGAHFKYSRRNSSVDSVLDVLFAMMIQREEEQESGEELFEEDKRIGAYVIVTSLTVVVVFMVFILGYKLRNRRTAGYHKHEDNQGNELVNNHTSEQVADTIYHLPQDEPREADDERVSARVSEPLIQDVSHV